MQDWDLSSCTMGFSGFCAGRSIMRFISQYPNNMEVLLYTVLTLCVLGILAALILYFVAQKFKVEEDPRIDESKRCCPVRTAAAADSPDVAVWPMR